MSRLRGLEPGDHAVQRLVPGRWVEARRPSRRGRGAGSDVRRVVATRWLSCGMTTVRVYPLTTRPFGRHPPHRSCEGTHDDRRRDRRSAPNRRRSTATAIRTARRGSAAVAATSRSAPRCAMQGPVGLRCRTCGKPSRDALASLKPNQIAIGLAVATGLGAVVGYFGAQFGFFMIVARLLRRHDHRRGARPDDRHQARAADPRHRDRRDRGRWAAGRVALAGRDVAARCGVRGDRRRGRLGDRLSSLALTFLLQYVPSGADRHRRDDRRRVRPTALGQRDARARLDQAADPAAGLDPTDRRDRRPHRAATCHPRTRSSGDRREQPAARLRVVGERDDLGRHAGRRRQGSSATKRRLCAAPPVSTPARASSSAPASAGSASASNTSRAPEARAISSPWPSSPKPVTSVAAVDALGDEDLGGRPVQGPHLLDGRGQVVLLRPALPRAAHQHARCPAAWSGSTCRRVGRHPCAAVGPDALRRRRPARTWAPDRGSCGRRQGCRRPRGPWPHAPSNTSASTSRGSSSGNAAIDRAKRTRPPIANTSLIAFAAAISPNVRASSTSGGKKSTVPMIARSSLTRYAAASSGGWRPAMSSAGAASAPRPASASDSMSAPSLAAHPPQSVSVVRRRLGTSDSVVTSR